MPITQADAFTVGAGTLTLGSGTPLAVSALCVSAAVVPSETVKTTDDIPTLDGGVVAGSSSSSLSYRFRGKFFQDGKTGGLVAYTWTNAGLLKAFTYTPHTGTSPTITGYVRIVPLSIGGDVSKTDKVQADFDWAAYGASDGTGVPTPTFV